MNTVDRLLYGVLVVIALVIGLILYNANPAHAEDSVCVGGTVEEAIAYAEQLKANGGQISLEVDAKGGEARDIVEFFSKAFGEEPPFDLAKVERLLVLENKAKHTGLFQVFDANGCYIGSGVFTRKPDDTSTGQEA